MHAAVFKNAAPEKPKVQPREVAKKAVAEIKKTPPQLFMVSVAAAVGIILLIVAVIAWRIHSENADEDVTPAQPAATAAAQPAQAPAVVATPTQRSPRAGSGGTASCLGAAEIQSEEKNKNAACRACHRGRTVECQFNACGSAGPD